MTITIRQATYHDIFSLEALGRRAMAEAQQLYPAYDVAYVLKGLVDSVSKGFAWVAVEPMDDGREKAVGGLVVGLWRWPQNPDAVMVFNEHLYVVPDYRAKTTAEGVSVGNALIDVLTGLADKWKIPAKLDLTFGDNVEARARLAERAGFRVTGTNHVYEPRVAEEAPPEDAAA